MRKLLDQTDFENINKLSKRWKKQETHYGSETLITSKDNKQLYHDPESSMGQSKQASQTQAHHIDTHDSSIQIKKRNHAPQIIDEDTEHFKNRLQNLLNCFKTDAVSEFMSMKKSMLDYQRQCVKSDTQKYLTLYEEKHQQLLKTKEQLVVMTREAEKKTIQCQQMANYISKLNERIKITRYLSRPFALLYQNKQREKMEKFKMQESAKHQCRKLKYKGLKAWMNYWKDNKQERQKDANEKRIEYEVQELVGKFQKEMESLKQRLQIAVKKNENYEQSKTIMQQNLKKAFLRGVCAMNMQAMSAFGDSQTSQGKQNKQLLGNMSYIDGVSQNISHEGGVEIQHQSMIINAGTNQKTNNIFMSQKKLQSKDHKWKEAPIMGIEEKEIQQQPRTINMVKHNPPVQQKTHIVPGNEGKVIRVVDGKSAVQTSTKRSINDRSIAGSRRKN